MDFIREWIFRITGIIALGAICDIIMIEGEMKKYLKPVLGFVLVLAVIRPITGLSSDIIKIDIAEEIRESSLEISGEVDNVQTEEILKLYREKLARKIEEQIQTQYKNDVKAVVEATSEEERFGDIKSVFIEVFVMENEVVNAESIKNYVSKEFGVKKDKIDVKITVKGG